MLKTPKTVDKDKFDAALVRLIQTPPIRNAELVGKGRESKKQK